MSQLLYSVYVYKYHTCSSFIVASCQNHWRLGFYFSYNYCESEKCKKPCNDWNHTCFSKRNLQLKEQRDLLAGAVSRYGTTVTVFTKLAHFLVFNYFVRHELQTCTSTLVKDTSWTRLANIWYLRWNSQNMTYYRR